MSVYRISYRYANSLILLAEEKNILKQIYADAELIYNTLLNSKELRAVLKNPVIKHESKEDLIAKIFGNRVNPESISFISFIIDKNREDILFEIFKEFLNLRDKKEGILRINVSSVIELSKDLRNKIEKKLADMTDKKIKAEYAIDNTIIGGFVVRVEDTIIDASIKRKLELLRKKFSEETDIVLN